MTESAELFRGTLKTIILKLLSENRRMYGYEITQKVKELTTNEIVLTYGALYPILHKLEEDKLVVTETEIVDGRARKYYSVTQQGNQTAQVKVNEFQRFVETMQLILTPKPQLSF